MSVAKGDAARLRAALLGLAALGLLVAALWATWMFLHGGFQSGTPVTAEFSAPGVGQQLPVGGDVKVRGVLVGVISDIRLEESKAVVEFLLDDDVDLPADSRAEIRSKTIFGEKWIELIPPGDASEQVLAAGAVIPDERTLEPLELERALQLGHDLLSEVPLRDLRTLLRSVADGFSGHEEAAGQAIDRGLIALRAVNSRSREFDLALRQLRTFAEWLDQNDTDLVSFMDSLDAANRALVGAAPEFRSSLQSLPVFLDDLASFQEAIDSDLGRLVEQGATVAEIIAVRSDSLTDIVVQLEPFTTVWNSGLRQPCAGEFEANLTCWQVYQVPGLDSRGLYQGGTGPHTDDLGDPGLARSALLDARLEELLVGLLSEQGDASVALDLARVIFEPLRDTLLSDLGSAR